MICRLADPYNQKVSSIVQDMKKHPTSENEVVQSTVCVCVCVCVCVRVFVCLYSTDIHRHTHTHNHEISLSVSQAVLLVRGWSFHCLGGDPGPSHCLCSAFFAYTLRPPQHPREPPSQVGRTVCLRTRRSRRNGNLKKCK